MFRAAVKGMWSRKRRLALTALSIVLGVSFVVGSFVFTDTIGNGFEKLFGDIYEGIDVEVEAEITDFAQERESGPAFDEAVLEEIAAVPGVSMAAPVVSGFGQLIDSDGTLLGSSGPPKFAFSWVENPSMNNMVILEVDGRPPTGAGEVVVEIETAADYGIATGQEVEVAFENGKGRYLVVGLATSINQTSFGGATLIFFERAEAQRVLGLEGQITSIVIKAEEGVSPESLVESIAEVLPPGVKAVTGEEQRESVVSQLEEALGFLNTALLVFAAVAVLVGAFIIQNTFRIVVAQRLRELALLRTIGATARQIARMVVTEATIVGLVGSAAGIGAGILLAIGIQAILSATISFPSDGLVLEGRTIVLGMVVGLAITLTASLLPALRASSVPPVAALRIGAGYTKRASLRNRAIIGGSITGLGIAGLVAGLMALGINFVGGGALFLFLGVTVLAPLIARPAGAFLGWPLPRLFGLPGLLAKENTRRQPRRTAATASALMIGVALVSFVAVLSSSTRASINQSLLETFASDLTLTSANFTTGVSPDLVDQLSEADYLSAVSPVSFGQAKISSVDQSQSNDTETEYVGSIAAVDPATVEKVWASGAEPGIEALEEGIIAETGTLEYLGWSVGQSLTMEFPNGERVDVAVTGTIDSDAFGGFLISEERFLRHFPSQAATLVLIEVSDDVEPADAQERIQTLAADYPLVQVQTKSEFAAEFENQIGQLVAIFTGLLALAIIIAILGITNTLVLSITERTREIGLLRAVGMTRRQVRRMVRWEAVITAVFGAVLGVLLGSVLGWAVTLSLQDEGLEVFRIPVSQLLIYVVLAGLAGVISAILPARSASRIKILDAIAYE